VLKTIIFFSIFGEFFKNNRIQRAKFRSRCVRLVLYMGRAGETRVAGIERDKIDKELKGFTSILQFVW
jgi:hypothetical protein